MTSEPTASPTPGSTSGAALNSQSENEITRRGLLVGACVALVGAIGGSLASTLKFFIPNVLYEPSQRFKMGKVTELSPGVTPHKAQRVWVVRKEKTLYAIWARCTHLGCTPHWFSTENRIRCPCHGSNFTLEGDVVSGPAPKPLWRCRVSITPEGDLVVDKSVMENRPGLRDKAPFVVRLNKRHRVRRSGQTAGLKGSGVNSLRSSSQNALMFPRSKSADRRVS